MNKKLLSLILALLAALCLLPGGALAADGYMDSGSTDMAKLSKGEIIRLLEETPTAVSGGVFETAPSCAAPYAPGKVRTELLQQAADRLNALRRIAGLPGVELDLDLCESAQYGAVLAQVSKYDHYPPKPADMSQTFYEKGYEATSTSNLDANVGLTIPQAVDDLMDDYPVDGLGHRRWQLNPTMGKVGFGYVERDQTSAIVVEKVLDTSGPGCDYNFISWPASGNFPRDLFVAPTWRDIQWSVTVNPEKYAVPSATNVSVLLRREGDGKTWSFSFGSADFGVNTENYGVPNVIFFKTPSSDIGDGLYTVTVTGLEKKDGSPASIAYQVDFFYAKTQKPVSASPTASAVLVDGESVSFDAYNIGGSNYFKLRDLACVLSGTASTFDVFWDAEADTIALTSGQLYTAVGGEMASRGSESQPAVLTASKIQLNGQDLFLDAYNIGGSNYFKLRDLGGALGFGVDWDGENRIIIIRTAK